MTLELIATFAAAGITTILFTIAGLRWLAKVLQDCWYKLTDY